MAKLIGTDPNQVPSNADLGTMAYLDADRPKLGQTTVTSAGTALIVERTGDASNLQFKSDGQNVGHIYGFKNGSGGDLAFYPTNSSGTITQRMKIHSDGYVTMPYQPTFTAYIDTRTNWTATGLQRCPFDGTLVNQGSHFNTSNNRFTAPTSGRYQFNLSLNVKGDIKVFLYKNGTAYHAGEYRSNPTDIWEHCVIETIMTLSTNDYVEAYVELTGTGFAWNGGGSLWDHFSGHLIN